jgi:methyltransferase (TIGR00027 family)
MTEAPRTRTTRTADDSWDITESVGATALGVAAFRAVETAAADPLIRDEFAYPLAAAAGPVWAQMAAPDQAWLGDDEAGRRMMEMSRHYLAVRTHYFDAFFTAAADAGIRQIVILAVGLDARAYRLDWPAGTTVFEIDQPKVLHYKAETLEGHGAVPRAHRVAVPIDLRNDWPAALIAAGFDPGRPTAWLAEGLLPYLPSDAQDRLFEQVTANSAPGSRIAVESFDVDPAAQTEERREARRQQSAQLRDRLGLDIDVDDLIFADADRADAAEWLAGHGWQVEATPSRDEMARLGRTVPAELADSGMDSVLLHARLEETR